MTGPTRQDDALPHRRTWPATVVLAAWLTGLLPAQPPPDPNQEPRWEEYSHGLSVDVPPSMRRVDVPTDDALVRFVEGQQIAIDVYIKRSPKPISISDLPQEATLQLGTVHPSANIVDQQTTRVADRPAATIYFLIPGSNQDWWVMGQGFVRIDDHMFVMLKLTAAQTHWPAAREVFDQVIRSIRFADPAQLAAQRRQAIEAGQAWRAQWKDPLMGVDQMQDQWRRIVENDRDVGYLRLSPRPDEVMGFKGVRVDVQSRVVNGTMAQDTLINTFVSFDGSYEVWSIRNTVRPADPEESVTSPPNRRLAGPADGSYSWAETGVRSSDRITVSREGPAGIQEYRWKRPPVGYLSQAEGLLMETMLAKHVPAPAIGFYTYHPGKKKIVFRRHEVTVQPDGGVEVATRPSPDMAQEVSYFDPHGDHQRTDFPGGRQLIAATQAEIASRWNLR